MWKHSACPVREADWCFKWLVQSQSDSLDFPFKNFTYSEVGPQPEKIAQGGPLQKRDIVDTKTHASCAACHNGTKQSAIPSM